MASLQDLPQSASITPLTVIRVDYQINAEEAVAIHDQFRESVQDDRPMIVVGPNVDVGMIEPYAIASQRAWLAMIVSVLALIAAITALILIMI